MVERKNSGLIVGIIVGAALSLGLFLGLFTEAAAEGGSPPPASLSSPLPTHFANPLPTVFLSALPHRGVEAGGLLTYTITVVNEGAADASRVLVTDCLPAETTFMSPLTLPAPQVDQQTARWDLGPLAGNGAESASVSFSVRVSPDAATDQELVNRVAVTMDTSPAAIAELVHRVNRIEATVKPEADTLIRAPETGLQAHFPAGAVTRTVRIRMTIGHTPTQEAQSLKLVGKVFFLEGADEEGNPVTTFQQRYTLTVRYEDEWWQAAGVRREEDLNLYYWREQGLYWAPILPCPGCQVDTVGNRLIAVLDHFTEFALGPNPNGPPHAADDLAATDEDVSVVIPVPENDEDPESDRLVVNTVGAPANGSATINDTVVVYEPAPNFYGADVFTYTVSDGEFADTATVTVTVAPVNDAPDAVNDTGETDEDTPVSIGVVDNDDDVEDASLIVSAVGTPPNGSATSNGAEIVYEPALNFYGVDVFTYTVSDGELADTAAVTVTVTPVNDAPVITDIPDQVISREHSVIFTVEDVDTSLDALDLSGESSDPGVIPGEGLVFSGGGTRRVLTITPAGATEETTVAITITVDDGTDTASDTFEVTVEPIRLYVPLVARRGN